jgi:hypothetical protein
MTSLLHQNNKYEQAIEIKAYFIRFITDLITIPEYANDTGNIYFLISHIQSVTGGMCQTSGECSLGQTIPI